MPSQLHSVLPSQFGAAEGAPPAAATWPQRVQRLRRMLTAGGGRQWLPLLVLLVLLAVPAGWAWHSQAQQTALAQQADTAERLLARLAELQALAADIEAGHRGHALTGDAHWLMPLQQAPARSAALLTEARTLASGDAVLFDRLLALAPLLTQRTEQLASAAEQRQRSGPAGLAAALAALDNRRVHDQLQRGIAELRSAAGARAAAAQEQAAAAAASARQATLIVVLLALAVATAALLRSRWLAHKLARQRSDKHHRHEAQARLQQAHQRLLESALAPIAFVCREGRIRRINPAGEALLGSKAAELAGQPLVARVVPEDQRKTERALEAAGNEPGAVQAFSHRWRRADGSVLHLRWSAQQALDDGTLVCVAHDDTEARLLAATAAQQATALQAATQAEADARQRAGAAQQRLNDFLATLSRCLRGPLASLLQQAGNAQQGLHGAVDPAATKAWAQVLERTRGLQEAVEHVLLLGRIEAGQLELQREAFDVWDTLNRSVELVRGPATRKGLRVALHLADDLGYAHGDTRRVEQALLHLLQEAVAASSSGDLSVAARRSAEGVIQLEITHPRSDGASDLTELLAPLQDADKPASAERLTQLLGVAMARSLLVRMGGTLVAAVQPPQGTAFVITLPADQLPQR
jgi:PAS domain S-box-containing protein